MAKIKEDGTGWYKIPTGRNFGESAARNWLQHNFNKKGAMRSLIAQHHSVEGAKEVLNRIEQRSKGKYHVIACHGYILVNVWG